MRIAFGIFVLMCAGTNAYAQEQKESCSSVADRPLRTYNQDLSGDKRDEVRQKYVDDCEDGRVANNIRNEKEGNSSLVVKPVTHNYSSSTIKSVMIAGKYAIGKEFELTGYLSPVSQDIAELSDTMGGTGIPMYYGDAL